MNTKPLFVYSRVARLAGSRPLKEAQTQMFPGAVGIDLAKALDNAFAHLRESDCLIAAFAEQRRKTPA
jgi:hypothetical protein